MILHFSVHVSLHTTDWSNNKVDSRVLERQRLASYVTEVGDITGVTIDWSDGRQSAGYVTKVEGDATGMTTTIWRECWNGELQTSGQ